MGRADSEPGAPGAARAEVPGVGPQRGLRRAVLVARKPGGRGPAIRLAVSAARQLPGVPEYADGFPDRSVASARAEAFVALFASLANLAAVAPQYASMFPPPGSCTVFQSMPTTSGSGKGQLKPLDGGEKMTVTGPAGTTTLTRFKP